jgi:hypothetical protein
MNTVFSAKTTVKSAIPATVYAKGEMLFVHNGADFVSIGEVGNTRKVQVQSSYPSGYFAQTADTSWVHDRSGVAAEMAKRINAYPVLDRQVQVLQARQDELVAKLKLAQAALQRHQSLDAGTVAALVREIGMSIQAAQK